MKARVLTEKLGDSLSFLDDKKVFLNSKVILAEDITSNIKLAELEALRNAKTSKNIAKLKTDKDQVNPDDEYTSEGNYQKNIKSRNERLPEIFNR